VLGFRAWDQNIRRDFKEQAKKLLLAGKVLHWFTCQAALEQGLEVFRLLG
jgi:hypothetical protein